MTGDMTASGSRDSWLVVSYFVNADGTAASHHIDDRLKALQDLNIELTVLSSPCGPRSPHFPHVQVASPLPSGLRYEVRQVLRRRLRSRFWYKFWVAVLLLPPLPLYLLEKLLLNLDSTWSWMFSAAPAAVVMAWLTRPAVIYSTGGPPSAHAAAAFASRVCGIPLIVEYQDPPGHDTPAGGRERRLTEMLRGYVRGHVNVLVFVTQQAATDEAAATGCPVATIYPGARPMLVASRPPNEQFILAHFGSLGGSRNLDGTLRAVQLMIAQQPELAQRFRLELYGNSSRDVQRQIADFPHPGVIVVEGKLPRDEAAAAMRRADVLLLIQNADQVARDTIPSKLYEYLQLGRPILALIYRNPELHQMLLALGHYPVEADDPEGARQALETLMRRDKDGVWSPILDSPYTVAAAAKQLVELAGELQK